MINDLNVAIALTERFNESEVIVSRNVLFQVIARLSERGDGSARMNVEHANPAYPYVHRVFWHGITFIHYSKEVFSNTLVAR